VKSTRSTTSGTKHPVTIALWGSGNPYREFLYVDDMAAACVFVMEHVGFNVLRPDKGPVLNTHINIGTGRDLTIKQLAESIKGVVGFEGQLSWDSSKPDGTFRKLLDVSKINKLGWKENVSLKDGIRIIYDQYTR
jgi:GDP-L-fucose synthase